MRAFIVIALLLLARCDMDFDNFASFPDLNIRPEDFGLPPETTSSHYDEFGQHDSQFDHELVTGSLEEARYFKQLDPEEAKERLGLMFPKMDINGNGELDKDELIGWIIQSFEKLDLESARPKFKQYDANQDGNLSWTEYTSKIYGYTPDELSHVSNDAGADTKEFIKVVDDEKFKFDTADLNRDGFLNETEFVAFEHPHNYEHMAPYEIVHTLRDFDKDNDSVVSMQEFLADDKMQKEIFLIERENFKRYDKNGDGILDREEMVQWVTPGFNRTATDEAEHLFEETDSDKNGVLSKEEVLDQHELWVGSQATDYGRHLETRFRDEL